jgi:glycine/D-amino acid oxidase-like deaminating enzyme
MMVSIWEQQTYYADAGVFIVGSGLMGLWTAYELLLAEPDLSIIIADSLPVPAKASTRNAGFACFGSPSEICSDWGILTEEELWQTAEMRYKGIGKIRKICGDTAIDFDGSGGFEVFLPGSDWASTAGQQRIEWLNKGFQEITGNSETYTNCTSQMPDLGLRNFGMMYGNSLEGGLHSGKLVNWLQHYLQGKGVRFLLAHQVIKVDPKTEGFAITLQTQQYEQICLLGRQVLWATNAALSLLPALHGQIKPARGQMLLSPEIPSFKLRGTFHFEEGYYYFRHLGNRLLIGGARHIAIDAEETLLDGENPLIRAALENFIHNHLPQAAACLKEGDWKNWSGIMAMSDIKKPMIGRLDSGEWVAMACNGMGVALTPVWAETVSSQMLLDRR